MTTREVEIINETEMFISDFPTVDYAASRRGGLACSKNLPGGLRRLAQNPNVLAVTYVTVKL